MKIITGIIFVFVSSLSILFAQSNEDIEILQNEYQSFNYSTVISKASNLLLDKERFSEETIIKIYTLKSASHFAMGETENARKTFVDILKLNENFELSNVSYSPKLIDLFKNVKEEFHEVLKVNEEKYFHQNEIKSQNLSEPVLVNSEINSALAKSLAVPGWGHLSLGDNTKGWVLTSASTVALGSMLYFIFDANSKEKSYLAETNFTQIQIKYDQYNKSYKIRNALIATYAAIWIYSQIDILFFSNQLGSDRISAHVLESIQVNHQDKITFSFNFPF